MADALCIGDVVSLLSEQQRHYVFSQVSSCPLYTELCKPRMTDSVCIGDVVSLFSEQGQNYVFSQVSSCAHTALHVHSGQHGNNRSIPNAEAVTFQMCVQNRYKALKNYKKAKQASEKFPKDTTKKLTALKLKISADKEQNNNEQEQKRQHGRPVIYGQIIQLKHKFTDKYIHVSSTQTSATEYSSILVELLEFNAKNAQFRIMPRYKVKSEGEKVHVDDQIVLESVKTAGQYLHVSHNIFGPAFVNSDSFELNLSVRKSGFTLVRYYKPDVEHSGILKAGSLFRLFHKELESYLTAEGTVQTKVTEDVHLRVRKPDPNRPKTLFPSTSSITYWQIENEDMMKGGTMKWGQLCRLKHFTTKKYLHLDDKGGEQQLTLTDTAPDKSTIFRLHPVIHEMDEIQFESYARIEHVASGYWLHGLNEIYKSNRSEMCDSMSDIQWSRAPLKQITASKLMSYDDAFTIQKVDDELVKISYFVSGIVPLLQKCIQYIKRSGMALTKRHSQKIILGLRELQQFMIVNGENIKDRQKLLRNLKVIDILVIITKLPYENRTDKEFIVDIIVECYNVMEQFLCGDSRKNELYLARFSNFFQTQTGKELVSCYATRMVMELFRDNRKTIDRATTKHIDNYVELLRKNKNYNYLDLLGVLCVCDGVSIIDNQQYITDTWLRNKERDACLYLTEVRESGEVYVSTDNKLTWCRLTRFAATEKEHRLFLQHQLDLFAKLCHGRNEAAIQIITDKLKWEEAFYCLKNDDLLPELRAKYCSLIISLFIDVGENISSLERMKLSFVWDEIDTGNRERCTVPDSELKNKYFPQLKKWINDMLSKNKQLTASKVGHNILMKQVLKLVHTLVKFGYYTTQDDIKALLKPIRGLMKGTNDRPRATIKCQGKKMAPTDEEKQNYRNIDRFKKNRETKAVVDVKYMALEIVDLFFNFRFNERLEKCIVQFKQVHGTDTHFLIWFSLVMFEIIVCEVICFYFSSATVEHLTDIFERTVYFKEDKLTEILLDLSNHKYDKMVQKSLYLINRRYSSYSNLFNRAVQAQLLLTDTSVKVFKECEEKLPVLRRLSAIKMNREQCQTMGEILDFFISCCSLDGGPEEPHSMNQTIFYNSGVLDDMFDILANGLNAEYKYNKSLQEIIKKAFLCLQRMARGNEIVQKSMFDRLDILLDVKGAEAEMAKAFTEVFTGNKTACFKIKIQQVGKIMHLVSQYRNETPEFLELLSALVKVEELNLPIKRNQIYVMKFFMQYRSDVASIIDTTQEEREKVLRADERSPDLIFMSALVDLLATCAEGENRFIESICQTIFSLDELLSILSNPNISNKIKKPFARFTLWVYMNTAGDGAEKLMHERLFWLFLETVIIDIRNLTRYMDNNERRVIQQLRNIPSEVDVSLHYMYDGVFPIIQIFFKQICHLDVYDHRNEQEVVNNLAEVIMEFVRTTVRISMITNMTNFNILMSASRVLLDKSELDNKLAVKGELARYANQTFDTRSVAQQKYQDTYREEEHINHCLNDYANNLRLSYIGENTVDAQLKTNNNNTREYDKGGEEELPLGAEFQEHIQCFMHKTTSDNSLAHSALKNKSRKPKYQRAKKLMEGLMISCNNPKSTEQERLKQEALDIKSLQILRAMIHNEERQLPHNWKENPKKHTDRLMKIESVQNELDNHGAMLQILPLLGRTRERLSHEVLAFLSAMLFNGNVQVQTSLENYFRRSREEHFFMAARNLMHISKISIKEKRALFSQLEARNKMEEDLRMQSNTATSITNSTDKPANGLRISQNSTEGNAMKMDTINSSEVSPDIGDEKNQPKREKMNYFKKDGLIELLFRTLGQMCDGQHTGLQNYLRDQPDNMTSVNIVAETTMFLNILYANFDDTNIALLVELFTTLNEFASGNLANSMVMFDNKIIELINFILRDTNIENRISEHKQLIHELKLVMANLVMSMIEEQSREGSEFANEIMDKIDNDVIHEIMVDYYKKSFAVNTNESDKNCYTQIGFAYFHILMRLQDIDATISKERYILHELKDTDDEHSPTMNTHNQEVIRAWNFYEANSMSVEILRNGDVQKVHFRVKNTNLLRTEVKEKMKWNIKRESQIEKIQDFVHWSQDIVKDINYQNKVLSYRPAKFFILLTPLWNWALLLLSFTINIIILATWVAPPDDHQVKPILTASYWGAILYILFGLHNVLSACLLVSFFLSNRPRLPSGTDIQNDFRSLIGQEVSRVRQSYLDAKFFSQITFYYIVFFVFSICGTIFYGYFFCFHLLHIVVMNQLLKRVLLAVTLNGKSLLYVFLLGIIVIYIYSIAAFGFFRYDINDEETEMFFCNTTFECFISTARYGLLESFHESIGIPASTDFPTFTTRSIFDVSFYIVVVLIGLNIVFGIIVDTFSELRDSKWRTDEDMRTLCFICGRKSYDFENHGNGFRQHVKLEHNVWSYLFFFIHLNETATNDLTALELHVLNMLEVPDYGFFPVNRALCLNNIETLQH
ncbi:inositol 1,4,5-trisphosphate-gated calcium channel ITPR1-like [Saccoglossus kowalevskii]